MGSLLLLLAFAQTGCQSKVENKAEEVQDDYKDVQEAKAEGDSSEVREEQTELDSSREEYKELKSENPANKNR